MTFQYKRLDKNNAAVLLVDHQTGLLSLVRDIDPDRFKNNVLALSDLAKYFKLPTILTTSFETGPNGPLVPELKEQLKAKQKSTSGSKTDLINRLLENEDEVEDGIEKDLKQCSVAKLREKLK